MRNRVLTMTVLLCLLVTVRLVLAQAPAAGPGKVGVINMQVAIGNTAEGKKASADIEKKYEPRRQDLQRQQQEITALQDQLQKQAATLSDEERLRLSGELEDKQKIFKRATEDASEDYRRDSQEAYRRLGAKMMRIINEYAPQNGYILIVDEAQIPVYYVAREIELTEEMIKRYDAANPVEASGTPPAATSGAPAARPATTAPKPPEKPKP